MKRFINKIKYDKSLAEKMDVFCDFFLDDEILDSNSVWDGVTFNIPGQAFGHDGGGGEYILLEDKSVGFCSSEGQCGRVAENITDFFTLITNCFYYGEFLYPELTNDIKMLKEYFRDSEETSREYFNADQKYDYDQIRRDIGKALNIPVSEEVALQALQHLYYCLTIEPPFIAYYLEDNGDQSPSGSLLAQAGVCVMDGGESCETEYSEESEESEESEDELNVPELEEEDTVTLYMEGASWTGTMIDEWDGEE